MNAQSPFLREARDAMSGNDPFTDYRLPMFHMRGIVSPVAADNYLRRIGNRRMRDPEIQRFLRERCPKDKRVRGPEAK